MKWQLTLLFMGGGVGTLMRYALGEWVRRVSGLGFPLGTLTINVVGCVLIGFLAAAWAAPSPIREEYRVAILVGVLGGFTTFSTFGLETIRLAQGGHVAAAGLYVVLSNVLGVAGAWAGWRAAGMMYGA